MAENRLPQVAAGRMEYYPQIQRLCDERYGTGYIDKAIYERWMERPELMRVALIEGKFAGFSVFVPASTEELMTHMDMPREEFSVYASMDPAKEVGGDFYGFFMVDRRNLAIVMADVSGKGVPAALFMVIGKTLIKEHTQPGTDLGTVFTQVNDLLCESNSEGLFITAFEGVLDLVTGEFLFVNAGHEIPFLARGGEPFAPYKIRAGFVLAGMENIRYKHGALQLSPGDKIFQYTDGVTEATNAAKELYGMGRLEKVLRDNGEKPPEELLPAVTAFVDARLEAPDCPVKAQIQIDIAIDKLFGDSPTMPTGPAWAPPPCGWRWFRTCCPWSLRSSARGFPMTRWPRRTRMSPCPPRSGRAGAWRF
nr:PP2C family protein-serine/threonine phosphatase [uncultured Oscillibacter sp.]